MRIDFKRREDYKLRCPPLLREKYGKHTVHFGSSFLAHRYAQHAGDRGDLPTRRRALLPGETKRRRVGIPMLTSIEL